MPSQRTRLRELIGSKEARTLVISHTADAFAKGIFMSSGVVFFTRVAGFSAAQVGMGYSLSAIGGLIGTLVLGPAADRLGAKRVLVTMLLAQAVAFALYPFLMSIWLFYLVLFLFGLAQYGGGPAFGSMINALFESETRVQVRSVLRTAFNVGFSVGTGLAAVVIAGGTSWLRVLPMGSALLMIVSALICVRLAVAPDVAPARKQLLGAIRDGRFMTLVAANFPLALHSTVLLIALPVVLLGVPGMPEWVIPLTVIVNTAIVIVLQIPAARGAETAMGAARVGRESAVWLAVACALIAILVLWQGQLVVELILIALIVVAVTMSELRQSAASWGMAHELAPRGVTAEYIGTFNLYSVAQGIVGPILLVSAANRFGAGAWFVTAVVVIFAGLILPVCVRRFIESTKTGVEV